MTITASDEQKALFRDSGDSVDHYRAYYNAAFKRATVLTDEEIIVMVTESEDDKDQADWAAEMLALEQKVKSGVTV